MGKTRQAAAMKGATSKLVRGKTIHRMEARIPVLARRAIWPPIESVSQVITRWAYTSGRVTSVSSMARSIEVSEMLSNARTASLLFMTRARLWLDCS
jgi:hypothetical protein